MRSENGRLFRLATFAFGALSFAHVAGAQQAYTWTGATSGDWNTPTNWNPNGVPGGNPEDQAEFDSSSRTSVTVSQNVELGFISFGYGPAYNFQLNGVLQLRHGILNLSTTTQNHFTTGPGTLWLLQDGDAANSLITNNATTIPFNVGLEFGGTATAGTAQITNNATGTVYFINSATAANAVIYNAGNVDYSFMTAPSVLGAAADSPTAKILLGSQTLSIGSLNYTQTIEGSIVDGGLNGGTGGSLIKVGSGFLQLTGNESYTGKTTVQAGLLEIDGSVASSEVLVDTGATLAGAGSINGNIVAQASSTIIPGDVYNPNTSPPNTALTAGGLLCAASPTIYERIGNIGSATKGDYLSLQTSLQTGFCPHLHFQFASAGLPLTVGDYYLLVLGQGTTNYTAANVDFDFSNFPSYRQANGSIVVDNLGGVWVVYLHLTDLGDEIFGNGFD